MLTSHLWPPQRTAWVQDTSISAESCVALVPSCRSVLQPSCSLAQSVTSDWYPLHLASSLSWLLDESPHSQDSSDSLLRKVRICYPLVSLVDTKVPSVWKMIEKQFTWALGSVVKFPAGTPTSHIRMPLPLLPLVSLSFFLPYPSFKYNENE